MDALTTSREDSTLYCINSQKKIINHKLVENEGDFFGSIIFPMHTPQMKDHRTFR